MWLLALYILAPCIFILVSYAYILSNLLSPSFLLDSCLFDFTVLGTEEGSAGSPLSPTYK